MNRSEYALKVFLEHYGSPGGGQRPGGTCLEIGPGLALSTAVISRAFGFDRTILLDNGHHAKSDLQVYRQLRKHFLDAGVLLPQIEPAHSLAQVLELYRASYSTQGDEYLRQLPNHSIRFSFSHAMLSQIPRSRVMDFLVELKRVSEPGSRSSHWIDLTDYFGGGVHQLRFSDRFWESRALYESGVYTNRMRFSHWLEHFRRAGIVFRVSKQEFRRFTLPKERLDAQFQALSEEDFLTCSFRVEFFWAN